MTSTPSADRSGVPGLELAWGTDIGRMRESNQDAVRALPDQGLLIVSDGMGRSHAGGAASRLVIQQFPMMLAAQLRAAEGSELEDLTQALLYSVLQLNHRVREEGSSMDGVEPLGATIATALLREDLALVAHMGDSRAYLYHHEHLSVLTRDHTAVNVLVRRGEIDPEEAEYHAMRGMLSRFVGMGGEGRPDIKTVDFLPGDLLLLCTDGLTDAIADGQIAQVLRAEHDLNGASRALIQAALEAKARDNITVLLARHT